MKKVSTVIFATILATQLSLSVPVSTFANEYTEETESNEVPEKQEIQSLLLMEEQHIQVEKATEDFILNIGEQAKMIAKEHDLYASVMIAQAILESDSGRSELSQMPYFNLFGIKGAYEDQSVSFQTIEDNGTGQMYQIEAAFKQYPSYKESFEDYAELLSGENPIFTDTLKSSTESHHQVTLALTGTYATDSAYNQKLDEVIHIYDLTKYDQEGALTPYFGGEFEPYNHVNYDSANSYAAGNCTQYVYNRITQLGGTIGLTMGNGMDWGSAGIVQGYEVSNIPKAGTAVSFQPGIAGADGTYGHVAFVENVGEDGVIEISEMNAVGVGIVSTRTIDSETAAQLVYITPK
ncbi:glucosaminidase domain-containing protein [Enterococcus ureasiticus]|nr:glucosaminidase domain-containing protein [Enterococcus ureasiticus]